MKRVTEDSLRCIRQSVQGKQHDDGGFGSVWPKIYNEGTVGFWSEDCDGRRGKTAQGVVVEWFSLAWAYPC